MCLEAIQGLGNPGGMLRHRTGRGKLSYLGDSPLTSDPDC